MEADGADDALPFADQTGGIALETLHQEALALELAYLSLRR
ncbi:MAG: hypothetical protein ACOVNL_06720 [Prochlorococcaceae cyanobacterium]